MAGQSIADPRFADDRIEEGSGNVFADIGLPNPEQALAKAKLTIEIEQRIERRRLTLAQVARLLGIDRQKLAVLVRGRFHEYPQAQLRRFVKALAGGGTGGWPLGGSRHPA